MSLTRNCECHSPRPKVSGVGQVVCQDCGGEVRAQKKGEAPANYDNIPDDDLAQRARDLERRQRQLQLDIQAFKVALKNRAASRERAGA
jgi:hypothetical protein